MQSAGVAQRLPDEMGGGVVRRQDWNGSAQTSVGERAQQAKRAHWPNTSLATDSANSPAVEWRVLRDCHGGPRTRGTRGTRTGAMDAVGTNWPLSQWVQRNNACRSMRCRKAWTDSTTSGSGTGAVSAARACASFTALPAGPSRR